MFTIGVTKRMTTLRWPRQVGAGGVRAAAATGSGGAAELQLVRRSPARGLGAQSRSSRQSEITAFRSASGASTITALVR